MVADSLVAKEGPGGCNTGGGADGIRGSSAIGEEVVVRSRFAALMISAAWASGQLCMFSKKTNKDVATIAADLATWGGF